MRAPRVRAAVVPLLLLPWVLLGCSEEEAPGPTEISTAETADAIAQLLRKRSRAIIADDDEKFLRTVTRKLRTAEHAYYANLQELPIAQLRYTVVDGTVAPTADGRSYWAEVETRLQLEDYDTAPVRTRDRWRFTLDEHGRRLSLSSTTDPDWETEHATGAQPWDVGPVRVVERYDVLGIFDATTVSSADAVLEAVSEGGFDVRSVIPEPREDADDVGIVVYLLSESGVLDQLSGRSVGDPERADGLTIAIPVDGTDPDSGVASYRVALNPDVLSEDAIALDRLVRHELTHVLLGDRGRGAPLWISEGIAEYVSVQRLLDSERRLPATALDVAAQADALPTDEDFGGPSPEAWYALSWWVCEYIATTYGDASLWVILDELAAGADQADVLADRLGLTDSELAQRGAALMATTYR